MWCRSWERRVITYSIVMMRYYPLRETRSLAVTSVIVLSLGIVSTRVTAVLNHVYLVAFENQINSMEGSHDNFFVVPRNRSESISAISEIIRGVRSDSFAEFADAFRGRSDSLSDSSVFLPLLIDPHPEPSPRIELRVEPEVVKPEVHKPQESREFRYTLQTPVIEVFSTETRVGAYSKEERQIRINRFRDKKKKRVWRKQIKYDCRKRLADTRPRIKGRFVSRKEETNNANIAESNDLSDYIDVLTGDGHKK